MRNGRAISTAAVAVLAFNGLANAAAVTWDGTTDSTWAGANWTTSAGTGKAWPGAGNAAVFSGGGATITVGTQSANGLTFNANGYTLASGTITLATGSVITTANGVTGTLASTTTIAAAAGATITKTGSGTLALNAANGSLGTAASPAVWTITGGTYSSATGIFDSVLSIGAGNNLGNAPTAAATQVILDAGTLKVTGTGLNPAIGATRTIQVNAAGGAIADATGNPYLGNIVNNAGSGSSLYMSNTSGTTTLSGVISGSGSVTWNGAGALSLQKADTYSGGTTINKGAIELGTGTAAGTGAITVNSGGMLSTLGSQITNAVTVNNGGAIGWDYYSGSGDYKGAVTVNGAATVALRNFYGSGAMSGTISGNITGSGSLSTSASNTATGVTGTSYGGVLTLSGTGNTYNGGTTIGTGTTIKLASGSSIGSSGTLVNNGTFDLGGNNISLTSLTSNSANYNFKLGTTGTANVLSTSSATVSGTTGIAINTASATSITPGTYTLISSSGGGLGSNVSFAGGQQLAVAAKQSIQSIGGTNYRITLNNTGSAVTATVAAAPSKTISIMPLGSSITAGQSAEVGYSGGGYRSELYQNLVNDGRFSPNFVGSSTATLSNGGANTDLMTTVGQGNHEGHPGYTTTQTLANLNGVDSSGGNNGGYWLKAGNGVNPDYITLNIGGNDFFANPTDTTAIGRLDQILTQIHQLRPNATVVVSNIMYRGDGSGAYGNGANTYYNPLIPGLVYQHVLAGEHVQFLDLYSLMTPNNSLALIGPDLIHPTQAGYNLMGDAWYSAITTGQAFFKGGASFNTAGNWAMNFARDTDAGAAPTSATDVYFNGAGSGNVALGGDVSVRSLNFTGDQSAGITLSGNTLTLGSGGVTVQGGTGAHTIASAVTLGSDQTWSNVSGNDFKVTGNVGGSGKLTLGGTGRIVMTGNNTFSGGLNIGSGTTLVATGSMTSSATSAGSISLATGSGAGTLSLAGLTNNGDIAFRLLTAGSGDHLNAGAFSPGTGTITVTAGSGLVFAAGESWDLVDWTSKSGTLDAAKLNLPTLPSGLSWDTSNLDTTGVISVVPEPGAAAILGAAGVFSAIRRRR